MSVRYLTGAVAIVLSFRRTQVLDLSLCPLNAVATAPVLYQVTASLDLGHSISMSHRLPISASPRRVPASPRLRVSVSPRLRVPASPRPRVPVSPSLLFYAQSGVRAVSREFVDRLYPNQRTIHGFSSKPHEHDLS